MPKVSFALLAMLKATRAHDYHFIGDGYWCARATPALRPCARVVPAPSSAERLAALRPIAAAPTSRCGRRTSW